MPLTTQGESVLESMKETYPDEKTAKRVFYASINKGKAGSRGWHKRKKRPERDSAQGRAIRRRLGR